MRNKGDMRRRNEMRRGEVDENERRRDDEDEKERRSRQMNFLPLTAGSTWLHSI